MCNINDSGLHLEQAFIHIYICHGRFLAFLVFAYISTRYRVEKSRFS